MRYAILSDIHSNWEALQAVLADSRRQQIDQYLCCGDIVGYGADPGACIAKLREIGALCVAGNHDWAVAGRLDASYFIPEGLEAVNWTRNQIGIEAIQFLAELPLTRVEKNILLVHGTPEGPEHFHYLSDIIKAGANFKAFHQQICFIGHCHLPRIFVYYQDRTVLAPGTEVEMNDDYKYIVDAGSVGQPRDGNPLAGYALLDTELNTIDIRRVPYDVNTAREKIIAAGLPAVLGDRLLVGH